MTRLRWWLLAPYRLALWMWLVAEVRCMYCKKLMGWKYLGWWPGFFASHGMCPQCKQVHAFKEDV